MYWLEFAWFIAIPTIVYGSIAFAVWLGVNVHE